MQARFVKDYELNTYSIIGSMHYKNPCPCCKGKMKTHRQKKCTQCNGLGGLGTFGACEIGSVHFKQLCNVCNGRCYL